MAKKEVTVIWEGREEVRLSFDLLDNGELKEVSVKGIGGPEFLNSLREFRKTLTGRLEDVPIPLGKTSSAILLRELLMKAKDCWTPPFQEDELCHCRMIPTKMVDQAICSGAHTPKKVSELTSASTACGTCRPDVEAMIEFRLGKEPKN